MYWFVGLFWFLILIQLFPAILMVLFVLGIIGLIIVLIANFADNSSSSQSTQKNKPTRKSSRASKNSRSQKRNAAPKGIRVSQKMLQKYKAANSDTERHEVMLDLSKRHKENITFIRERLIELGVYIKPEKRRNIRQISEHMDDKEIALLFIRMRAWAMTSEALQQSLEVLQTSRDRLTTTKGNIGRVTAQRLLRKLVGLAYEDLEIWEASINELQAKTAISKRTLQIGLSALQEAGLITELEQDADPDWELRFRLNVILTDDEEKMVLDALEDGYETLITSKAT